MPIYASKIRYCEDYRWTHSSMVVDSVTEKANEMEN